MDNINFVFAAAFAVAIIVLYAYGRAIAAVKGYANYRRDEQQRQYHVKQLQVFIDAAKKIDNVIQEMTDAIPVRDRRESLQYADFDTISRILESVNAVADRANRLHEVFLHDFAFAQQSEPFPEIEEEPSDIFISSYNTVKDAAARPSLSKREFWRHLNGIGIYRSAQIVRRGKSKVEQTIISQLQA